MFLRNGGIFWHGVKTQNNSTIFTVMKTSYLTELFLFMVVLTTLSVVQTIQRRLIGLLMNNELEMTWKESVVTSFEVLSRYLTINEKNTKNLSPGRGLNLGSDVT